MATDGILIPLDPLTPAYHDDALGTADPGVLAGTPADHREADRVAALTATPPEAAIDARMGLRGVPGRTPRPEDFTDVMTDEGNSGDVFGADVVGSPFVYGEDGSTRVP